MGRGKAIRSTKDYLKEPYKSIIEFYLGIGNKPLQLKELRYLLLKNHGLKSVIQGTTKGEKMTSRELDFREKKRSLRLIREMLEEEGKMLVNTAGRNKGKPMTTNALNRLLQTMKSVSGQRILKKIKKGYRLVGNPFLQFVRMERERRISECPDDMVTELRHGLTLYNLPTTKKLRKQLKRTEGLHEKVTALQKEVARLWAKRKISLFIGKLRAHRSVHGNGNFLGYCYEMVRWFVGSLGLDKNDFKEELKRIEEIAKNKATRMAIKAYGSKINACKQELKEMKTEILVSYPSTEVGGDSCVKDMVETSLVSGPGVYSWLQGVTVAEGIWAMVEKGRIGRAEGELLLLEQEMSEMYGERGLHRFLSSDTFDVEPIVVLDTRLAH